MTHPSMPRPGQTPGFNQQNPQPAPAQGSPIPGGRPGGNPNPAPPMGRPDAVVRLEPGAICPRCGYGLGGLDMHGVCPECAAPAHLAAEPDRFRNGPPELVKKQASGASMLFWGTMTSMAAPFVMIAMAIMGGIAGANGGGASIAFGLLMSGVLLALGGWIAVMLGWWKITVDLPGVQTPGSRVLVRAGVVAVLVGILAMPLMFVFPAAMPAPGAGGGAPAGSVLPLVIGGLLFLALGVGSIVFFFASFSYLKWVAGRVPNESLASFLGHCMWIIPVLTVLSFFIGITGLVTPVLYAVALGWMSKVLKREYRSIAQEPMPTMQPRPMNAAA